MASCSRRLKNPSESFGDSLVADVEFYVKNETDYIANVANVSALIYRAYNERNPNCVNWAGFYVVRENQLVLSGFQGKAAVTRIAFDKGICGKAYRLKATVVVADVHAHEEHIACDSASQSEIVVPIFKENGEVAAVIDMDSPNLGTFTEDEDKAILERIASIMSKTCVWP